MDLIMQFHRHEWVQPIWAVMYLFALGYVLLHRRYYKNAFGIIAGFSLIQLFIVYCPITVKFLVPSYLNGVAEYSRLAWNLLIVQIIALVMVELLMREHQSREQRKLLLLVFVFLILVSNRNKGPLFVLPENPYKISSEAVALADTMAKDATPERQLVGIQIPVDDLSVEELSEYGKVYYGIRQYSGQFILSKHRLAEDAYTSDGRNLLLALQEAYPEGNLPHYFIVEDHTNVLEAFASCGYDVCYQTEHCVLLKLV